VAAPIDSREPPDISGARAACRALALRHYENFPVGRFGIPRSLRPDIHAVYAFARVADDYADEPQYEGRRLGLLDDWGRRLESCVKAPEGPVFTALGDTIARLGLPLEPFRDLISAFRQDAVKQRYADWGEVMDYCRRSANPVGRLVLLVTGKSRPELLPLSDALCTALQLANFWQDLSVDLPRGRCYVPAEEAERHGVSVEGLVGGEPAGDVAGLVAALVARTAGLFELSRPLPGRLGGMLARELAATWLGGRSILTATARLGPASLEARPRLGGFMKATIVLRALRGRIRA